MKIMESGFNLKSSPKCQMQSNACVTSINTTDLCFFFQMMIIIHRYFFVFGKLLNNMNGI